MYLTSVLVTISVSMCCASVPDMLLCPTLLPILGRGDTDILDTFYFNYFHYFNPISHGGGLKDPQQLRGQF